MIPLVGCGHIQVRPLPDHIQVLGSYKSYIEIKDRLENEIFIYKNGLHQQNCRIL